MNLNQKCYFCFVVHDRKMLEKSQLYKYLVKLLFIKEITYHNIVILIISIRMISFEQL